jgi:hypothetical protein
LLDTATRRLSSIAIGIVRQGRRRISARTRKVASLVNAANRAGVEFYRGVSARCSSIHGDDHHAVARALRSLDLLADAAFPVSWAASRGRPSGSTWRAS